MTPKALRRAQRKRIAARRSSPMQSWYAINKAGENEAEIKIFESIGYFGVTAKQFSDELEQLTASTIHLRLNTPGGDVFDGFAIANSLRAHPANVIVHVDGLAASAGSIIAMSGDEIRMADNSFLMIHEARGGVMGEADDMRKYADTLDKINDTIALTYQGRAGQTRKYWRDKMADETWYTAAEAKAEGLADAVDKSTAAENRFDFGIYNKAPDEARKLWGKVTASDIDDASKRFKAALDEQANQISAPEPAASAADAGSQTQETLTMSTASNVAPAQTPAAGTSDPKGEPTAAQYTAQAIQSHIENGKKMGRIEGEQAAQERFKALLTACPDRLDLVCSAFQTGQSAEAVALMYNATKAEAAKAHAMQLEKDREIARLQAQLATGGHAGVPMTFSTQNAPAADAHPDMEPEAQAEMEWQADPMIRAKNGGDAGKKHWLLYRTNQLKGGVRVLSRA